MSGTEIRDLSSASPRRIEDSPSGDSSGVVFIPGLETSTDLTDSTDRSSAISGLLSARAESISPLCLDNPTLLTKIDLSNKTYCSEDAMRDPVFRAKAEDLITQILHSFSQLLELNKKEADQGLSALLPFQTVCLEFTKIFYRASNFFSQYLSTQEKPSSQEIETFSFFHDNKTLLSTLCINAFGINPMTEEISGPDLETLSSLLEPYRYSLRLSNARGEIELDHLRIIFHKKANLNIDPSYSHFICDNPKLIWQVLSNLISNGTATKYGDGNLHINFDTDTQSLIVRNGGAPIAPVKMAELNIIFTGKSITSKASKDGASSGGGLSALVCEGAKMKCLGAWIDPTTDESTGTAISVVVEGYTPIEATSTAASSGTPPPSSPFCEPTSAAASLATLLLAAPLPLKVFIVEDNESMHRLLKSTISKLIKIDKENLSIQTTYEDSTVLSEFLAYFGPKLLLADQNVPKGTGSEFVLKNNLLPSQVIFITDPEDLSFPREVIEKYTVVKKENLTKELRNLLNGPLFNLGNYVNPLLPRSSPSPSSSTAPSPALTTPLTDAVLSDTAPTDTALRPLADPLEQEKAPGVSEVLSWKY